MVNYKPGFNILNACSKYATPKVFFTHTRNISRKYEASSTSFWLHTTKLFVILHIFYMLGILALFAEHPLISTVVGTLQMGSQGRRILSKSIPLQLYTLLP